MRPRLRTRPIIALLAAYALALQALLTAWGPAAAAQLDPTIRCNPSAAIGLPDGSLPSAPHECGDCVMPGCSAAATLPRAANVARMGLANEVVNATIEWKGAALHRARASARGPPQG